MVSLVASLWLHASPLLQGACSPYQPLARRLVMLQQRAAGAA